VPFRKCRHLRSRFRAFNLFRGIPIAGERRKDFCRERYGHVWKLSQRMSKCRQKGGCAFTWNLCFDAVLTFVASYWAWIVRSDERK